MLNANRPSVIMLSVVKAVGPMLYCYAQYHYTEFHFAQCLYAKRRLARIQDAVFIDILCAVLLNVIYAECCFSVIFTVCLVSFYVYYATCCFTECNIFIVMLSVVTTSVIFLSVAASSKRIRHCLFNNFCNNFFLFVSVCVLVLGLKICSSISFPIKNGLFNSSDSSI